MRELKFRVWHIPTKTMYWFDLKWGCRPSQGGGWIHVIPMEDEDLKYQPHNWVPVDPMDCKFIQFTSLKDKNSKDIYEGDIIFNSWEYDHPDGRIMKVGNYEVKYLFDSFGIVRTEGYWSLSDFGVEIYPSYAQIHIEVIGNIFENSERLTDTK